LVRSHQDLEARLRLAALRGIQFLPDSDEILPESEPTLQEAVQTLQQVDPTVRVEIGGHTDSWSDPAHNRELSLRRAKAVRRYLVEHGVDGLMLIAAGYGETRPIASNDDPDGRFANRRIEFQVRGPVR
jgi:OmpA-OmpF porin, OOP family